MDDQDQTDNIIRLVLALLKTSPLLNPFGSDSSQRTAKELRLSYAPQLVTVGFIAG